MVSEELSMRVFSCCCVHVFTEKPFTKTNWFGKMKMFTLLNYIRKIDFPSTHIWMLMLVEWMVWVSGNVVSIKVPEQSIKALASAISVCSCWIWCDFSFPSCHHTCQSGRFQYDWMWIWWVWSIRINQSPCCVYINRLISIWIRVLGRGDEILKCLMLLSIKFRFLYAVSVCVRWNIKCLSINNGWWSL